LAQALVGDRWPAGLQVLEISSQPLCTMAYDHDGARAKILTESLEISNAPKFGYFGFPGPLCIGDDSYAPRLMKKKEVNPDAVDHGEPIRNILTSTTKKGMHPNVFFSFAPPLCLDDPYVDGHSLVKRGKVTMIDPDAAFRPPGKIKQGSNKLGYEYVPHMDGVKDPRAVKEALQGVLPLRQIYTNPTKKGGGGVLTGGVLFGFGEEGKPLGEHVPDDYDAAKKERTAEIKYHQSKLQECPFRNMGYGNNNFASNNDTYGCKEPTHIPRDEKPDMTVPYPHENAFRPANPSRKGMLKGLIGGFPEYIPEPSPGGALRKAPIEGEAPPAFRVGAPTTTFKPTPSVTTLTRNMRNERPSSFARPLL